jgi:2-amino-4-hydroxy-6-hydroxymethyldihydropteridine diphosphokinase
VGDLQAYFSLGANQGNRAAALRQAYRSLCGLLGSPQVSGIYETDPMYLLEQPRFLNAVCAGTTSLDPLELLGEIQRIEAALGRRRDVPNGPRTIDVDILLLGDRQVDEPALVIPHPGIRERAFVLVPLLEIAPELRDPLTGTRYRACLDSIGRAGVSYLRPLDA